MKIRELIPHWEKNDAAPRTDHAYSLRLPVYDAAKLAALEEMYPGKTQEQILSDLLAAALDELEASFAYIEGSEVIAYDDRDDPVYADAGLSPRFQSLTRRHAQRLLGEDTATSEK